MSLDEIGQMFKVFIEYSDSFSLNNYLAYALLLLLAVCKSELIEAAWTELDLDQKK